MTFSSERYLSASLRPCRRTDASPLLLRLRAVVIWRRNRFQGTGSKVPEPVPKPGTRNRFLTIVSLTHCIMCVLCESLFVNNESRNIGVKLCVLVFTFSFIYLFIYLLHLSAAKYYDPGCREAMHDDKNFWLFLISVINSVAMDQDNYLF